MERIWLKSYPAGVAPEVDMDNLPTLVQMFEQACRQYADRVAFVSMGKSITYRELDELSARFATWLVAKGYRKGDRVALMMPNVLQYPVALFGTLRAGCTVVNCNPLYTPRELEHQLVDSGARGIVIVENFAHVLEQVLPRTLVKDVVVTPLGEMLGGLKGVVVNFVVRHVKKMVPAWNIPGCVNFGASISAPASTVLPGAAVTLDDVAFLQYTGGTTGVSKGAILTHRNIASNVMQAYLWTKPVCREGEEFILTALPLYHIFALTANCLKFMMIGASNLLIVNARDLPTLIKEWGKYPITVMTGVNTLFNGLLNNPEFAKLDFSKFRLTLGGGMAVQGPVAERWKKVTGVTLSQAYGLTETSPAVTINPLDLKAFNGSIGLPVPSTDISVRDDNGQEVAQGQIGEICVSGPQVMVGYWQRPDETAKVMTPDGFLRTGDMGYVDAMGYVFLVDRKKDMILVSGFNVYPNEVEEALAMHPNILEVAAVGVPDDNSGEVVKVFVVPRSPGLTQAEVIEFSRTVLTGYKVPKHVELRKELPKTNVGKILRRALRDEGKA
jgi:long-chain acyl-CoA synthetase